jgi:YspA, cpYpsA-related SLOG family
MKVIVCGGRDFSNTAFMWRRLDKLHAERAFTELMQGGARGADALARDWARSKGLKRYVCEADWKRFGRSAGPKRNARMLEWKPDLVVAFPTAQSIGTWDMVRQARAAGVETIVVE